jgi:glycine/D-amino acid oxidase-like deaminating enzyme
MVEPLVVVGGGIVGTSVAAHLAERADDGRPVRLFERNAGLAAETTGASLATWRVTPPTGDDPLYRMKRYSMGYYNRLVADSDRAARFELVGQLTVATTEAGAADLRADATGDAPATQAAEYLSPEALCRTIPCPDLAIEELSGALYRPYLGYFDAEALVRRLAERARGAGAQLHRGAEVTGLLTDGDRVTGVIADGREVPAAAVVSAAGASTPQVAEWADLELPLRYTAGHRATIEPARPLSARLPKLDHHESAVGFRGADGGRAVAYRTGPTADVADYYDEGVADPGELRTDELPGTVAASFRDIAARLLPPLAEGTVLATRGAPLSRTPDGRPVVGWTARPGLSVAALHAAGVQLAPAVGDVIAGQLLAGEPTPLHDAVTPARFGGREVRTVVGD